MASKSVDKYVEFLYTWYPPRGKPRKLRISEERKRREKKEHIQISPAASDPGWSVPSSL
jgi:hypothetical protein